MTPSSSTRRAIIAAGAALAASGAPALAAPRRKAFPKGFHWGAATAAHQIEGNNTNADFWFLENIQPTTFAERSGDACDSYHRYEDDIALLRNLGLNSYRFSLEWARIEPSPGKISIAELDHYKRVLAACRRHGVSPAVTFVHNTAPRWFAEKGGWLNPDAPSLFARYCAAAAKALGGDMDFAFTLNEPQVARGFRSIPGGKGSFAKRDAAALAMHEAAAKALNVERFVTMEYPDIEGMTPILMEAHRQGFAAIKAERSSLPTGVTLNILDFEPATEDSPYEAVRKQAYGGWLDTVRAAGDFAGVQIYRRIPIPGTGKALPPLPPMPFSEGLGLLAQWARPEAMANGVTYVHAQTGKPIIVSENGMDTENDARRAWYIQAVLESLHDAIAKGVPVLGYYHWSLIDNFEWSSGYKPKYGLAEVDRTTFKRTPKASGRLLGAIARRNAI